MAEEFSDEDLGLKPKTEFSDEDLGLSRRGAGLMPFEKFKPEVKKVPPEEHERPMPGIIEAAGHGAKSGWKRAKTTFDPTTYQGVTQQEPESPAAAPYEWGKPQNWMPQTAYRVGQMWLPAATTVAGAGVGATAGIPAGPGGVAAGGLAGAALGAAGGTVADTLGPYFQEEIQKTPDDFEGAWKRAVTASGISAGASVASTLFRLPGVASYAKQALAQLVAQPAINVGERAAVNVVQDKPISENLIEAGATGAVTAGMAPAARKVGEKFTEAVQGYKGAPPVKSLTDEPAVLPKTEAAPAAADTGPAPWKTAADQVIAEIANATKVRAEADVMRSQQKGKRFGAAAAIEGEPGQAKAMKEMAQMRGEYDKPEYQGLANALSQENVDALFARVSDAIPRMGNRFHGYNGLRKLLGDPKMKGAIPQPSELIILREAFGAEFVDAVAKSKPTMDKALSVTGHIINFPRSVMSAFDVSMPFRQAIMGVTHPKEFALAFKDMYKHMWTERNFEDFNKSIRERPGGGWDSKFGVQYTGKHLGGGEEQFASNIADKIVPGVSLSSRAASAFLNSFRSRLWDNFAKKAARDGIDLRLVENEPMAKQLATFVNALTGRGPLGKFERYAPLFNGLFFSPRLAMSRAYFFNPHNYVALHPFVRRQLWYSALSTASLALIIANLAKLNGADVNTDPRNADFGKIKEGNTRYDFLGGMQQYTRFLVQMLTGQRISSQTGRTRTVGEGYPALTRWDILHGFAETKFSPIAGLVANLAKGTDPSGRDVSLSSEVIERLTPMIAQDLYDLWQDREVQDELPGLGKFLAQAGLIAHGVGIQTYGATELRKGENKLGQQTVEIQPKQSLGEYLSSLISEPDLKKTTGPDLLSFQKELTKLPRNEQQTIRKQIQQANPELFKRLLKVDKETKLGVTPAEADLKIKGVASGDRALAVEKELDMLPPEQRRQRYKELVKKKIITDKVDLQLKRRGAKPGQPVLTSEDEKDIKEATDFAAGRKRGGRVYQSGGRLTDEEIRDAYRRTARQEPPPPEPRPRPPPPSAPLQRGHIPPEDTYWDSTSRLIPTTMLVAPRGIPWQRMRRSENVEDRTREREEDITPAVRALRKMPQRIEYETGLLSRAGGFDYLDRWILPRSGRLK